MVDYVFTDFILFFQNLYDSIKKEPFKIPEDDGNDLMHTFFNPDKEGWLWKQGGFASIVWLFVLCGILLERRLVLI